LNDTPASYAKRPDGKGIRRRAPIQLREFWGAGVFAYCAANVVGEAFLGRRLDLHSDGDLGIDTAELGNDSVGYVAEISQHANWLDDDPAP
jgi:hypothetical protein